MLLGLAALRGGNWDAAPAGDQRRQLWLEDAHVSGVARSSALPPGHVLLGEVAVALLALPTPAILALDGAGSTLELIETEEHGACQATTCYAFDALAPIARLDKGALPALPSLHRAGQPQPHQSTGRGCPPPPGAAGGATR